jgi:hypothetical protein
MNNVNFLEGVTADPGRLQTVMPMSTVGDFENYLERLRRRPCQVRTTHIAGDSVQIYSSVIRLGE